MYRVLIADDEELELKAMHFFLERNYAGNTMGVIWIPS